MPKEAPVVKRAPIPEEMLKNKIRGRFNLNAETIQKFQSPGEHDPLRAPDDRTRALLDIATIFQLYKISMLKAELEDDYDNFVPAEQLAESIAYFEAVQDVVRAMVYGAACRDIIPETEKVEPRGVYEEMKMLLARMSPLDNNRAWSIQKGLTTLLDSFEENDGCFEAVEADLNEGHRFAQMVREMHIQNAAEAARKLSLRHP